MVHERSVERIFTSRETIEGAGVRLRRAFGFTETPLFDPFLMLDDFRADRPEDYLAGFPWHPHRGIETVSYMLEGKIEHGDSMGHAGIVGADCVQWMTAGSGILHQEMPKPDAMSEGRMGGFQLWVNLPKVHKMMDPRYQEVTADRIPAVFPAPGVAAKIIAGTVNGTTGPVREIVAEPGYLDVSMEPGREWLHRVPEGHKLVCYVIGGDGAFGTPGTRLRNHDAGLFTRGDAVRFQAGHDGVRFLLFSGKPIGEPIAWRGPIVMNTDEELRQAFREYREGTFIRKAGRVG
jgi:redox-sensitive bicupin YhaK (pirin superfamily)